MAAGVAILGSLGVLAALMAVVEVDARSRGAAGRWAVLGGALFAVAVVLFVVGDVHWAFWLVPAGLVLVIITVVVIVG